MDLPQELWQMVANYSSYTGYDLRMTCKLFSKLVVTVNETRYIREGASIYGKNRTAARISVDRCKKLDYMPYVTTLLLADDRQIQMLDKKLLPNLTKLIIGYGMVSRLPSIPSWIDDIDLTLTLTDDFADHIPKNIKSLMVQTSYNAAFEPLSSSVEYLSLYGDLRLARIPNSVKRLYLERDIDPIVVKIQHKLKHLTSYSENIKHISSDVIRIITETPKVEGAIITAKREGDITHSLNFICKGSVLEEIMANTIDVKKVKLSISDATMNLESLHNKGISSLYLHGLTSSRQCSYTNIPVVETLKIYSSIDKIPEGVKHVIVDMYYTKVPILSTTIKKITICNAIDIEGLDLTIGISLEEIKLTIYGSKMKSYNITVSIPKSTKLLIVGKAFMTSILAGDSLERFKKCKRSITIGNSGVSINPPLWMFPTFI